MVRPNSRDLRLSDAGPGRFVLVDDTSARSTDRPSSLNSEFPHYGLLDALLRPFGAFLTERV
jgi:hypothetical protein